MRSKRLSLFALAIGASLAAGCVGSGGTRKPLTDVKIPVRDTTVVAKPEAPAEEPAREAPPGPGPLRSFRSTAAEWGELSSGLSVGVLTSRSLPLVEIRVAILGGKAGDADRTGLAALTGELVRQGAGSTASREALSRLASIGGELGVETGPDATVLRVAVTKDQAETALGLLATLVRTPPSGRDEFARAKKLARDRAEARAAHSGRWGAMMVLLDDLFQLPTDTHPYASYEPTPEAIDRITLADVTTQHKRFYVAKNTLVAMAGDVTAEDGRAAVERAFTSYRGGEAPTISFTDPTPPSSLKVTLVDMPKSAESDVYVGVLAPPRSDASFPGLALADQILGGGAGSRLFDSLQEPGVAYSARSTLLDFAHGPSLLVAHAGTETEKTGLAVEALLAQMTRLATTVPTSDEVERARRGASYATALRLGTLGAIADEVVRLRVLGLSEDHDAAEMQAALSLAPEGVSKAASEAVRGDHAVVVVAGDAVVVGPMLVRFGDVKVVDPRSHFARLRTLTGRGPD